MTIPEHSKRIFRDKISRRINKGELPISSTYLNEYLIPIAHLAYLATQEEIQSFLLTEFRLEPQYGSLGITGYDMVVSPIEELSVNYKAPTKGEGRPARRLHNTNGKELPLPGQDLNLDDAGEPRWTRNRNEW